MLGEINKKLAPYHPSIYLAKPDRTIICKLSEAYNINIIQNLNGIHEISLEIPYQISRHNKNVRNKHVDLLRGHYLLKVDADWFVISNNQSSSSKESMQIEAKLLPYQLRRKTIFSLAEEKNATEILNICLADTPWSVAYVDADFALQLRKFEVNEKTKLEFLFDIAEAYNGVLKFDTENLTVSIYKLENVGTDKGLSISYGKYLKDINKNPNFDDVCTRLYVYGKDGLEIISVNPTGTAYLEDFSYYLHPYSETITDVQNDLYTVNAHSHYLSDELCHAILKHNKALEDERGNFTSLFNELETLNNQLVALQQELEQLDENLLLAKDELALHNAKHNEDEDQDLIAAVTSAEEDYNAKLIQTEAKKAEINVVNGNIESLRTSLELANTFTPEQLQERDLFIFERKWTNDSYSDANELYQRGITELKKASQPQIAYSLDIVDFLKVVECQHDWDKLAIGDIVTVKYEKFKIDIKAKIIRITRNIDANKLNIEIANTTDINRGFYEWVELLKKSVSTSAVLNTNKCKWDEGYTANSKIENYINNKIDAAKQAIVAGVNQSVNIDRQGIKISDPADHDNFIRILHNVLAFTNDGGNTFKHAITSNGIVGDYIYGKLIAGVNLTIESTDSQSFRVDENGVTIAGSALTITNGLPVDQLASGVILEGSPYNGVVIDSTEGIVITRSDSKVKAT
ncbi:MAG: phage tail protein, partial [Firmicutes bacterium]|nr:phage tail protein [Bacillota bacterium]